MIFRAKFRAETNVFRSVLKLSTSEIGAFIIYKKVSRRTSIVLLKADPSPSEQRLSLTHSTTVNRLATSELS